MVDEKKELEQNLAVTASEKEVVEVGAKSNTTHESVEVRLSSLTKLKKKQEQ